MTSPDSPTETEVDPVYDQLAATPEFHELRRRYIGFVFPATIAFMSWYLLYVFMSMFAGSFMNKVLFGHINVALVFGLLQFLTTFAIAWLYSTYSNRQLDPLAEKLRGEYEVAEAARGAHASGGKHLDNSQEA